MQYAGNGVNYTKKSFIKLFMKLTPVAYFIKLFWNNSHHLRHNLGQNLWRYANSGINYTEKLVNSVYTIKLFFIVPDYMPK
jgi:hypothetical protein